MPRRAGLFVGLSTLDIVYRVAAPPGRDEKVQAAGQELAAGGPVSNAAVTFAALGGAATLVTALGRHVLARYVASELAGRGVTVVDATPERTDPPALSSVYVVQGTGERSVVSVNAAGADPPAPAELAELAALAAAAPVVLLDGQHGRLARAAAGAARAAGRIVLLDAGSWKPSLPDLLPLVDLAACSAAFRVLGAGSVDQTVAALQRRYGVPAVAVTAGPDPVRWWYAGATGELPVPAVRARDTLGAGDAFHGALAWALGAPTEDPDRGGKPRTVGSAGVGPPAVVAPNPSTPAAPAGSGARLPDRERVVAALAFAVRVAALRCEITGPRAWLDDPRLADLATAAG